MLLESTVVATPAQIGRVLEANRIRINLTLARGGSGYYQSNTTWDWEPNSCGRSLGPRESSSHKSRPPITLRAPPLEHVPNSDHQPGRGASSLHRGNRRRRSGRRARGPAPDPRHGEGERPRTRFRLGLCNVILCSCSVCVFVAAPARLRVYEISPVKCLKRFGARTRCSWLGCARIGIAFLAGGFGGAFASVLFCMSRATSTWCRFGD